MSKLDTWIDNKIFQNIAAWAFFFLIFVLVIHADNKMLTSLQILAFVAVPIYINNLIIVPFFIKKNVVLGAVLFLFNCSVFTIIGSLLVGGSFEGIELRLLFNVFGALVLGLIFGTAIKLTRDSFLRRQKEKEAELKLLKAQLNPHFLFNTLNNLYGLSVVKSDTLPSLMLQLSDLLRYSLYDTKEQFVSLDKEIQYLENYVSLEKIRLDDKVTIQFNKSGDMLTKSIAPMLLIVFVENAFKHQGESSATKSEVSIRITVIDNKLHFECMNTIDKQPKEQQMEKGKSGIGLKNVKKRLQLIYPNNHKLLITEDMNHYVVKLTLTL